METKVKRGGSPARRWEEKMFLQGVIDRVDTCEDDDEILMKVIDYKSENEKFELEDFYYGFEMQLVIYMNAAEEIYKENEQNPDNKPVVPAGIFIISYKTQL